MSGATRFPMLARLAFRYARRHRVQTLRAVLGLVVVSLVLTLGLGLGDSLTTSLERSIDQRYGPVEVVVRGPPQFNASFAGELEAHPDLQAFGLQGVPTFVAIGSISNERTGLAEAFATLRGVDASEPAALGPLPGGIAEPGPGEVVISQALADRIGAQPGDRVRMRALPTDLNQTLGLEPIRINGTVAAGGTAELRFPVKAAAEALLVNVDLEGAAGGEAPAAEGVLRSPEGQVYPVQRSARGLEARVLGSVGTGNWTLEISAPAALAYQATAIAASIPPDLESLVSSLNATVSGIVPTQGRAAVTFRPAALLPLADLQAALGAPGQASHVYFGSTAPQAAEEALETLLGNETWRVDALKADALQRIRTDAGSITGFILVMSGFTLVASALLAYVLFSSLVEERRVELGIARAVGLTRREVATTMLLEAGVYAVIASVAGVLIGLGLVSLLVDVVDGYSRELGGPAFSVAYRTWTLPLAFLGGLLLPVGTIALGTLRFARLDPARAIRGAPDDVRVHRRLALGAGVLVLLVGVALSAPGLVSWATQGSLGLWATLGVGIAAAGGTMLLLGMRRRGWAAAVAGGGIAFTLWTLYTFEDFPPMQRELDPVVTMLRALVVTLLLAALAMCSPKPFRVAGSATAHVGPLRRAGYVAWRYMGARRVQAGLTAAMVAVVAVVVAVMGTLAAIFAGTIVTQEGGFDVVGQSPFLQTTFPRPLPDDLAGQVEHMEFVPLHSPWARTVLRVDGEPIREGRFVRFAGVSPGFAQSNGFQLEQRDGRYATDADAWQAVAEGEALLAPPWFFGPGELESGDLVEVSVGGPLGGGANRTYVVAGMVRDARRSNLFVSYDHVRLMGFPQSTLVMVRVEPGADSAALAHRLTDEYQADGLVFESIAEEAQEAAEILQASILVLQSFLFLGVFVGVSSTGFLAARAVHERMRDIGTLRAMGYEAKDVRRAFMLESTLVAALGVVLGTMVGLLVAHSIWWRTVREFGGAFVLPWWTLGLFAAAVILLAALASWSPTRRAARLDPSAALRYVE